MSPSSPLLWMVAGFAAILLVGPLVRLGLAALLAPAIGRAAPDAAPDAITLEPASGDGWRDAETIDRTGASLEAEGFAAVGDYAIAELPRVRVRLLVHEGRDWVAAIHEHPHAGIWCDLVRRHVDGTSVTWTTAPATGLEDRPGHPIFRVPGAHPGELFLRACREAMLTAAVALPADREGAAEEFRAAWADSIAWWKTCGHFRQDVLRTGARRLAA